MTLRLLSLSCMLACTGACSLPADVSSRADSPQPALAPAAGKPAPPMSDPARPGEVANEAAPFTTRALNTFNEPWAMTFLPDGRALVTEKRGELKLVTPGGVTIDVSGTPTVAYAGQGGLGDVVLHPQFATNRYVYLSHVEAGSGSDKGAVVVRYRLDASANAASLSDRKVIWTQVKTSGNGHFGHRIAFGPDAMLWITSGDRQKFDPAQDMASNLGKVIRLFDDGRVPTDNPFAERGGVTAQIWSLGHRNPLGIAFDGKGQLWTNEMGPAGGDELNLIERGTNYGYPIVSNGNHYDGRDIPDHVTRPEFNAPEATWNPVISPAGFVIYSGDRFPQWRGHGLIGGLSSQALVRVEFNANTGREAARYPMGKRIREVEQGPNGALYVLEDGEGGRLLELVPKS